MAYHAANIAVFQKDVVKSDNGVNFPFLYPSLKTGQF